MGFSRFVTSGSAFLLAASLVFAQDPNQSTAPQNSTNTPAAIAYPDTADGLRDELQQLVAAIQRDDVQETARITDSMVLPDYKAWFVQVFGANSGPKLADLYSESLKGAGPSVSDSLRGVVLKGRTNISAKRYEPADETVPEFYVRPLRNAMQVPTTIYEASAFKDLPATWTFPGFFFYVNGGFRFVGLYAFRGAPGVVPTRVRVGGNVQAASITHMVHPVYPSIAERQHVQGTVVLHAIIGRDGKIMYLEYLGGPALLKDAAIDAVRQWIYKPTLFQGQPVEVDTTISVVFALNSR